MVIFLSLTLCFFEKTVLIISYYTGKRTVLRDLLQKEAVKEEFLIVDEDKPRWEYLKGSKKEKRITKDGYEYNYSEGAMIYPDALDNASRTIITGEGGK